MIELLTIARSISFALQADKDPPLTKREQKQGVPDSKIIKARKQLEKLIAGWQEALTSPWHFEEFNGFIHLYERPKVEAVRSNHRLESRQDIDDMIERMKNDLRQLSAAEGNQSLAGNN